MSQAILLPACVAPLFLTLCGSIVAHPDRQRSDAVVDMALASAFEAQAASVGIPGPPERAVDGASSRTRTVGNIEILERTDAPLSSADLDAITTVLRRVGRNVWRLDATERASVAVFGIGQDVSPLLRRGGVGLVTCADRRQDTCGNWEYVAVPGHYLLTAMPGGGTGFGGPSLGISWAPPVLVYDVPNLPAVSDEDVLAGVAWLRDHAAAAPTTRLTADIQPWPVDSIQRHGTDRLHVTLRSVTSASQKILLALKDGQWMVVEMR